MKRWLCFAACALLLMGCDGNATPVTPTPTAPARATPTATTASVPAQNCAISAEQLPQRVGAQSDGYLNDEPVDVKFSLQAPWDFSSGPTAQTMQREIVATSSAKDAAQFAGANQVVKVSGSLFQADGKQFEFHKIGDGVVRQLGVSFSWGDPAVVYDPPYRERVYPLKVGDAWKDTYTLKNYEGQTLVQVQYEVLACGTLSVPAGTFEKTLLIRSTVRGLNAQGHPWNLFTYDWLAPDAGDVAWITSQVNEQQRIFTRASNFYRMRTLQR